MMRNNPFQNSSTNFESASSSNNNDLFSALASLGVDNPKKQIALYLKNSVLEESIAESESTSSASSVSFGPYTSTRYLGFVNRTGKTITLGNEVKNGTGTVNSRLKNGVSATVPVTLATGDLYEVRVSNPTGRCYISYTVTFE